MAVTNLRCASESALALNQSDAQPVINFARRHRREPHGRAVLQWERL